MSKRDRFIEIGWDLIKYKLAYYYPDMISEEFLGELTIPDSEYDSLEKEYISLCRELKERNTIVHKDQDDELGTGMFEVDFNRPCVHLVLSKYGRKDIRDQLKNTYTS